MLSDECSIFDLSLRNQGLKREQAIFGLSEVGGDLLQSFINDVRLTAPALFDLLLDATEDV